MKKIVFVLLIVVVMVENAKSQEKRDSLKIKTETIYLIIHQEGYNYTGKIISQDEREIILETKENGKLAIPKYMIKSIKELKPEEVNEKGEYIPSEVFSTRYFITTNGLPIEKGESYIQWNLYGPDFQFGIGKNTGVGIMTSWIGMPVIGTFKYSISLGKKINLGLGTLLGTGSWALPDYGIALPFSALTLGDRRTNVTLSMGYGAVIAEGKTDGRFLLSGAALAKIGKKVSLVFDSFIMTDGGYKTVNDENTDPNTGIVTSISRQEKRAGFALLIPGVRWQLETNKAFQFGFAGLLVKNEFLPVPIPMIQWYRKL